MKKYFFPFLLLALTGSLSAQTSKLIEEFLDSSLNIKIADLEYSNAVLSKEAVEATNTWNSTFTATNDDNKLDAAAAGFNANQIKTRNYTLGISKSFDFGLSLSLENELEEQDRSALSGFLASDTPIIYEFGQTISFTQNLGKNFLGRQFEYQLNSLEEFVNFSKITLDENKQLALSEFYRNLLLARQGKTLRDIAKEGHRWSVRLLRVTEKRVRDGLNEKADLYQAQLNERQDKETLESASFNFKSVLLELSEHLRREVTESEIDSIPLGKIKDLTRNIDYSLEENFDYKQIQARIRQLEWEKKQSKRDYYPTIALSGAYSTNDFDGERSTTFDKGSLGGDNDNTTIALNVSFPLGLEAEKVNLATARVNLLRAQLEKEQVQEQLKFNSTRLKSQMETRRKNLVISEKRLTFARQNLQENNRLYNIGRIDIDRLLRAEEDLLNTQRGFVANWFEYEQAVSEKASLYGKLLEVLKINL